MPEKLLPTTVQLMRTIILFLVALLMLGLYWGGIVTIGSATTPIGRLSIPPKELNFGQVWETDRFTWPLTIHNESHENVRVIDFHKSCKCVSVEPRSLFIPAHSSATINVTLDLTDPGPSNATMIRSYEETIRPRCDPMIEPVTWKLQGQVRAAISCQPRSVNFYDTIVAEGRSEARIVDVRCATAIKDLEVFSDRDKLKVTTTRITEPRLHYKLAILPSDALQAGDFVETVRLQPIHLNGEKLPALNYQVRGTVIPDIHCTPRALHFGAHKVGDNVSGELVFHSVHRKGFTIAKAGSATNLSITIVTSDRHDLHRVHIAVCVSKKGHGTEVAQFQVLPEDGEPFLIEVPVQYFGVTYETDQDGTEGI